MEMERKHAVTVYFSDEEFDDVVRIARRVGLSYSDVCRLCVRYVLNEVLQETAFTAIVQAAARLRMKGKTEKGKERKRRKERSEQE